MMRRRRKVDPLAMLWTVVLGLSTGGERTLASLCRVYQRTTGTSLAPSAFYDRFTPELVRFLLRGVVDELSQFADVAITDATVIKLHRLLSGRYRGCRTHSSPAAAKGHVVMSVMG